MLRAGKSRQCSHGLEDSLHLYVAIPVSTVLCFKESLAHDGHYSQSQWEWPALCSPPSVVSFRELSEDDEAIVASSGNLCQTRPAAVVCGSNSATDKHLLREMRRTYEWLRHMPGEPSEWIAIERRTMHDLTSGPAQDGPYRPFSGSGR